MEESDAVTIQQLRDLLGDFFAQSLAADSHQAMGILVGQEG
jgi:hypothetical protein